LKHLYTAAYTLLFCLALSSCSYKYYAPGLYQNDVQNMLKPHSKDTVKNRTYATGTLLTQGGAAGQGNSTSGLLNIYRAHTIRHFNFAYGALGYAGSYQKDNYENQTLVNTTHKSFLGYGFNGSTSWYVSGGNVDFRIIGVDLVYTHESGDFLAFRKSVAGQPGVLSATQATMFSYSVFSEATFKLDEDFNLCLKFFASRVTGNINQYLHNSNATVAGGTGYLSFKRFTIHSTVALGGNNITPNAALQMGLTYGF
jgi:hypothetical protein